MAELKRGSWPGQAEAIALISGLPYVEAGDDILAVAKRYVRDRLVPASLTGDAVHLAAACMSEVDFLLTWNIRHLANPNKLTHLTVINRRMGLLTPQIVTPEMLWMEET